MLAIISVGYYATQDRLGVLVGRIGRDEEAQLARNLSRQYTDASGSSMADRALSQEGNIYPGVRGREPSVASEG